MPFDPPSLLWGLASSGIVTSLVTYRFTLSSGRIERRIDFRGFLGRWLADIQRVREGDHTDTYNKYIANVQHLSGYAAKLRRDFFRKRKFIRLCEALIHIQPEHIQKYEGDGRKVVSHRIQDLIDFV